MHVNKVEIIVRCICLWHIITTDLEGTTCDPSVLQETVQIHSSCHAKTMSAVDYQAVLHSNKDMRVKAHFNGPDAATLSQKQ
jgi:hypothetical protein